MVKGRKATGKFELNYLVKHSCTSISRSMNRLCYHKDWQIIYNTVINTRNSCKQVTLLFCTGDGTASNYQNKIMA